jgi:hypothetical protein
MNDTGTDRQVIHLDKDYEREGWAAAFGVTEEELVAAVKAVGNYLHKPEGSATIF